MGDLAAADPQLGMMPAAPCVGTEVLWGEAVRALLAGGGQWSGLRRTPGVSVPCQAGGGCQADRRLPRLLQVLAGWKD